MERVNRKETGREGARMAVLSSEWFLSCFQGLHREDVLLSYPFRGQMGNFLPLFQLRTHVFDHLGGVFVNHTENRVPSVLELLLLQSGSNTHVP